MIGRNDRHHVLPWLPQSNFAKFGCCIVIDFEGIPVLPGQSACTMPPKHRVFTSIFGDNTCECRSSVVGLQGVSRIVAVHSIVCARKTTNIASISNRKELMYVRYRCYKRSDSQCLISCYFASLTSAMFQRHEVAGSGY